MLICNWAMYSWGCCNKIQLIYFSIFDFNKIPGEERTLSLVKWFIQIGWAPKYVDCRGRTVLHPLVILTSLHGATCFNSWRSDQLIYQSACAIALINDNTTQLNLLTFLALIRQEPNLMLWWRWCRVHVELQDSQKEVPYCDYIPIDIEISVLRCKFTVRNRSLFVVVFVCNEYFAGACLVGPNISHLILCLKDWLIYFAFCRVVSERQLRKKREDTVCVNSRHVINLVKCFYSVTIQHQYVVNSTYWCCVVTEQICFIDIEKCNKIASIKT